MLRAIGQGVNRNQVQLNKKSTRRTRKQNAPGQLERNNTNYERNSQIIFTVYRLQITV